MKASQLSGDSTVHDVRFADGTASLLYEDYESERTFRLSVDTHSFYSEASCEDGSVHLEFRDLRSVLQIEPRSGRYMLPPDFGQQMSIHRKLGHLALGLKASSYPLLLVVKGSNVRFAAPITSEESITLTELPESSSA